MYRKVRGATHERATCGPDLGLCRASLRVSSQGTQTTKPTGFGGTPSRPTGRIRTTAGYPARQGWVAAPDLSAPFLNSLLGGC